MRTISVFCVRALEAACIFLQNKNGVHNLSSKLAGCTMVETPGRGSAHFIAGARQSPFYWTVIGVCSRYTKRKEGTQDEETQNEIVRVFQRVCHTATAMRISMSTANLRTLCQEKKIYEHMLQVDARHRWRAAVETHDIFTGEKLTAGCASMVTLGFRLISCTTKNYDIGIPYDYEAYLRDVVGIKGEDGGKDKGGE